MTDDPLAKVTRRKAPGAALVSTFLPLFVPLSQQCSFRVLHHLNLTTGGWAGILSEGCPKSSRILKQLFGASEGTIGNTNHLRLFFQEMTPKFWSREWADIRKCSALLRLLPISLNKKSLQPDLPG